MKLLDITNEIPPPIERLPAKYADILDTLQNGQCADVDCDALEVDRARFFRAADRRGIKITTRKTDKGTLKVWRLS